MTLKALKIFRVFLLPTVENCVSYLLKKRNSQPSADSYKISALLDVLHAGIVQLQNNRIFRRAL